MTEFGLLFGLLMLCGTLCAANFGSGFTYQGRLIDNGRLATGLYDLKFRLLAGETEVEVPVTQLGIPVEDGAFSTIVNFGPAAFNGDERELEISVRSNGTSEAFLVLARQPVTPVPYSLYAGDAGHALTSASVEWSGITSVPLLLSSLGIASTNGPLQLDAPQVAIGTTTPGAKLHVRAANNAAMLIESVSDIGTWLSLRNGAAGGRTWSIVSSGPGNGEGAGKLLFYDGALSQMSLSSTGVHARVLEADTFRLPRGVQAGGVLTARANGEAYWSTNIISLFNEDGIALRGMTTRGTGVLGDNQGSDTVGHAGYFNGRVRILGTLTIDRNLAANGGITTPRVLATTVQATMVQGSSIVATNNPGITVAGYTTDGTAIFGDNQNSDSIGHAGFFNGRVRVTQGLNVGGSVNANAVSANTINASGVSSTSTSGFGLAGYTTDGTAIYGDNGNSDTLGHAAWFNGRVRVTQGLTVDGPLNANGSGLRNLNASYLSEGIIPAERVPPHLLRPFAARGLEVVMTNSPSHAIAIRGEVSGYPENNSMIGVFGQGGLYGVGVQGEGWFEAGIIGRSQTMTGVLAISPQGDLYQGRVMYSDGPVFRVSNRGDVYGRSFNNTSDRNQKEKFQEVNAREVLNKVTELPINTWSYKAQSDVRHIGPVAQDFYAAFNVGDSDKHIATVDFAGVALAAIKGLREVVTEKEQELQQLKKQNQDLAERLSKLEKVLGAALRTEAQ